MKIAYLHGLESSIDPKDPKIVWLNDNFKSVYTPKIDYKKKGAFSTILRTIKNMDPHYIVGSSMGGYFAYLIGSKLGIKTILFNPAVVGRSFDPFVDDIDTKGRNGHNLFLGKSDNVINGDDVRKFFGDSGMANVNTEYYSGGHRVPVDVFINSIKKVSGVNEIYNNIQNKHKVMKKFEQFVNEKREDVGKYNTVKKVVAKLGRRPSEQELAQFINNNYYDVTEVEREDDDPSVNDKIADLVGFYKFDIDDWEIAWEDAQNESVVTEAKNTIGLAFKDEDDYNGFVEFIKDEKGSIKKDFGWDSKTKSWEVIMDVKVLDSIYGEGTPGNKESGWYGALPGDFESVIIESVVTEKAKPHAAAILDFYSAVEKAGNFENIGKELKTAGYEFEFEDNKNNPAYKVKHDGATFAIANKKYWGRGYRAIEKKVGDIAIGWVFPNDTYNEATIQHSLQTNKINESETVYHKYDFEGMWAQKLGMTREEYVAHFATMTVGVDESSTKDYNGIQFDVKGINFTYTDVGRFYGASVYDVPKTANVSKRAKFSLSEITQFLASIGIKDEVPVRYDTKDLDKICKKLAKKGIVCDHDDSMDVS